MSWKKFRRAPTQAEWDAEIAEIKRCRDLDRSPFRRDLEKLARKLEELGRAAHRAADRIEGLSVFSDAKFMDVHASRYSRSRIETPLKRWYKNQLHFIQPQLDRLVEIGKTGRPNLYSRGVLRRQAATLLDAAELIDDALEEHKQSVRELRARSGKSKPGRPPKTANRKMVRMLVKWNFTPTTLSARLRESGIAIEPENLKVARWLASSR